MESSLPSTQILDSGESAERKNEAKNYSEVMSTLPKVKGWRGYDYYLYQGFWYDTFFLEGLVSVQEHFHPQSTDIFVASSPKTGTTWLKALTFAILTRSRLSGSTTSSLLTKMPHDCVPFLESDLAQDPKEEEGGEVQKIISMCSFEELSSLEVNKNAVHRAPGTSIPIQNSVFFRKGEIGDWANHLTPEMGARLDDIMEKKLKGSGLKLPRFCNSAICIDNDSAKQGSNEAFQFPGLQDRECDHLHALALHLFFHISLSESCPRYNLDATS
ncbi:hypothetical protein D5086_022242 [Populus alba]|uniref:Uncharacterized protein n=1 Tax=Populus alba TaxID=43335 RepID=A0ACC4BEF4_POPAL